MRAERCSAEGPRLREAADRAFGERYAIPSLRSLRIIFYDRKLQNFFEMKEGGARTDSAFCRYFGFMIFGATSQII